MSEITITLASLETGQSESIPVASTTLVNDLKEWARALLNPSGDFSLAKDGKPLAPSSTLQQAGVQSGDLLSLIPAQQRQVAAPAPAAPSGGLDFSTLLNQAAAPAPAAAGGLNFSNLLAQAAPKKAPEPFYHNGMNLEEATHHNRHPETMIRLLQREETLFKELNYYNPMLAEKLRGKSLEEGTKIWREEMVKGGIRRAVATTSKLQKETAMKQKLQANANDTEAKAYFEKKENEKLIQAQYHEMMQNYPESMGRVLMLYINASVNDKPVQAFVDSGAQSTIMSKYLCEQCGISHLIDTRFEGVAKGVGTGKILGRIHIVSLKIGDSFFPCTVTVMENMDMGFLLGLDMLKRHLCQIDLEQQCLRFRLAPGKYMSTPFLHEKDLAEDKGGTKGFDLEKANQEFLEIERKREAKAESGDEDDEMET